MTHAPPLWRHERASDTEIHYYRCNQLKLIVTRTSADAVEVQSFRRTVKAKRTVPVHQFSWRWNDDLVKMGHDCWQRAKLWDLVVASQERRRKSRRTPRRKKALS